jgi:hypothetical protein
MGAIDRGRWTIDGVFETKDEEFNDERINDKPPNPIVRGVTPMYQQRSVYFWRSELGGPFVVCSTCLAVASQANGDPGNDAHCKAMAFVLLFLRSFVREKVPQFRGSGFLVLGSTYREVLCSALA